MENRAMPLKISISIVYANHSNIVDVDALALKPTQITLNHI